MVQQIKARWAHMMGGGGCYCLIPGLVVEPCLVDRGFDNMFLQYCSKDRQCKVFSDYLQCVF